MIHIHAGEDTSVIKEVAAMRHNPPTRIQDENHHRIMTSQPLPLKMNGSF
jgi:hypothetical protein